MLHVIKVKRSVGRQTQIVHLHSKLDYPARSSETLVSDHKTTRRQKPKDVDLEYHRCESLKFLKKLCN
jgi:hypothetical protein